MKSWKKQYLDCRGKSLLYGRSNQRSEKQKVWQKYRSVLSSSWMARSLVVGTIYEKRSNKRSACGDVCDRRSLSHCREVGARTSAAVCEHGTMPNVQWGDVIGTGGRSVFWCLRSQRRTAGTLMNLLEDERFNHWSYVEGGILEEACGQLLTDFSSITRRKTKRRWQSLTKYVILSFAERLGQWRSCEACQIREGSSTKQDSPCVLIENCLF